MRRAALLVAGGTFTAENLAGIGKWWRDGCEGVLVVTCDGPDARLVLVDLDQVGPPRAVGDTDADGRELLILQLPAGAEGVQAEHAVQAAKALGATPAQCKEVLDEALRGRRVVLRAGPHRLPCAVDEADLHPAELHGEQARLLEAARAPLKYGESGGVVAAAWAVELVRAAPAGYRQEAVERGLSDETFRAAVQAAAALGGRRAVAELVNAALFAPTGGE